MCWRYTFAQGNDLTPTLAATADRNFVTHASWVQRRLPGSTVVEDDELVVSDSGLPCDTFNFICRARLSAAEAQARAADAIGHFRRAGRPFSWWVGPADTPDDLDRVLVGLGLTAAEGELAMAMDLAGLPPAEALPGLQIARVRTRAELSTFATLSAGNWTPPDRDVVRFYELGAGALLSDGCPLALYLGWQDGEPVATAEATVAGGVAGLYNIATLPAFRRRGIGRAMTLRPLADARAAGCATAVLQAAPDGVSIYERAGFRAFGTITEYKP